MARIAKCQCVGCNAIGTVKISLAKRGERSAWLCGFHAENLGSYSLENDNHHGKEKVNGFTFGMELETSDSDSKARVELASAGFLPTSDCTVDVEYKSSVFEGLNALSKQTLTIERLMSEGHMAIGEGCGTHFHVGHHEFINRETISYIARFYHSLFIPLCNEMKANSEATERLFGRDFTYYASPISEGTDPYNHCNFVNLQHSYSLEFRLCKFRNAKQFMACVKFAKEATNAIIENFVKHFNDTDFDTRRYSNAIAYRKHKAQVTANKLVKIYRKYAEI